MIQLSLVSVKPTLNHNVSVESSAITWMNSNGIDHHKHQKVLTYFFMKK